MNEDGQVCPAPANEARHKLTIPDQDVDLSYVAWVRQFDAIGPRERSVIRRQLRALRRHPLISIILPVHNPDLADLNAAIESVRAQLYQNWELCIADDASNDPSIAPALERHAAADTRIKLTLREHNGHISACSNSALSLATGEWIALLDHDDLLPEHALAVVAHVIISHPDAGVIYSDEDKLDEFGERCSPYFKSDWNPELLLGQNCISHLGVYRHSLVREVGGFREGFEGSQDYDLALRCVERLRPDQIVHVPRILYHWRMTKRSVAHEPEAKPYARDAARRAIADFLQSNKIVGRVTACPENPEWHRVIYDLPAPAPLASVIIPTRDRLKLLRQCITTLRERTRYSPFEILVVDNGSEENETLIYLDSVVRDKIASVVKAPGEFNFSRLVNLGANSARGEILVLLNNDIEVSESGWLREMVSHARLPQVGAVGARLWLANGTLQHGGVITGLAGVAAHAFYRFPPSPGSRLNRNFILAQNYSAVTAACMAVRKQVFEAVQGFDERFPTNFNDVDFCLRLRERGWQVVWTPYANLIHHESASRGRSSLTQNKALEQELRATTSKWGDQLLRDPFYSPNLSLTLPGFDLAFPPRLPGLSEEWSLLHG